MLMRREAEKRRQPLDRLEWIPLGKCCSTGSRPQASFARPAKQPERDIVRMEPFASLNRHLRGIARSLRISRTDRIVIVESRQRATCTTAGTRASSVPFFFFLLRRCI